MIPVGTLCIVRQSDFYPALSGRICEVVSRGRCPYLLAGIPNKDHEIRFSDEPRRRYWCESAALQPIVPPGNPDAVPQDEREPEQAFR